MKNAYTGYTYQHLFAIYLVCLMDVERKINSINIEEEVDHKFDDVFLKLDTKEFYFQIKDYDNVSLNDIRLNDGVLQIKGKDHKLSDDTNILVFSSIDSKTDTELFGFSAMKCDGYFIISANRNEIEDKIEKLYGSNVQRRSKIESHVHRCIEKRAFSIHRTDLPSVEVYKTNLSEKTIHVGIEYLKFENLFFIEGKPGIGKSHLVNLIQTQFKNNIIYRFWISNQDNDYLDRLLYRNFLQDISKQLFNDLIHRSESEILSEITLRKKTVIIDGLDHVENYNHSDLNKFISFIDSLRLSSKVIILSRPLTTSIIWEKHVLCDWNLNQTEVLLEELYHISDNLIRQQIFELTNGYPILIKYVAEFYKSKNELPILDKLTTVGSYYDQILNQEKGKQALSLFLCFKTFVMKSELSSFLIDDLVPIVNEFIDEHPYLFEIRLNRISLFHDSLITYLRNTNINFEPTQKRVNQFVYDSIMSENLRFLSRFNLFNLDNNFKKQIIKKYSNIRTFKRISKNAIDFESIQAFYSQLISELQFFSCDEFEIIEYYDLSLIINIVHRDHVSTMNDFYFTYVKSLKLNGFSEEDISSSAYLFSMFYYLETQDSTLLFNFKSNNHFSTDRFHFELDSELNNERDFFERQSKPLTFEKIIELLNHKNKFELFDVLTFVLTNIFVHQTFKIEYHELHISMEEYFQGLTNEGIYRLNDYLSKNGFKDFYTSLILNKVEMNVKALGFLSETNEYLNNNLEELIHTNSEDGSFNLLPKVNAFMRLSEHQKRKIDIKSIGHFWTKYHQRKDYSFLSIPNALFVYEKKGYLEFQACCELIFNVQDISEKGYGRLFNDFICLYPSTIIERLQEIYDLDELSVQWFQLPAKYLDVIPESLFTKTFIELINYNNYSKIIDFNEIENLINSVWNNATKKGLEYYNFTIRIEANHPKTEVLILDGFNIEKTQNKDFYNSIEVSQDHYSQGILNKRDIEFIRKKIKSPVELSGFQNGWYSTLADIDLFEEFKVQEVQDNFKSIIYNAILGKVGENYTFPNLYYFPGNLPKLILDYKVDSDFKQYFNSFRIFVELSSFNLSLKI